MEFISVTVPVQFKKNAPDNMLVNHNWNGPLRSFLNFGGLPFLAQHLSS